MIEIVRYQNRWPGEFADIAALLRQALGKLAVRVDHIGSTSVPGLASKDVIDVQLSLESFENFDDVESRMTEAGFICRQGVDADHRPDDHSPPGTFSYDPEWEKRYFRQPQDVRSAHIHVRAVGRRNWRYALLFRDYLRVHPDAARAYETLKVRLAAAVSGDRGVYPETKDPVCDLIILAAEPWASATNWDPGPSDT